MGTHTQRIEFPLDTFVVTGIQHAPSCADSYILVGGCRHLRLRCMYRDSHDGSLPHVQTVRYYLTWGATSDHASSGLALLGPAFTPCTPCASQW